jgi:hypothetical protein
MSKKTLKILCFTILLFSLSLSVFNFGSAASTPLVHVYDPSTQSNVSSAAIGEIFTVEIDVANVETLVAFEFYLTWNTSQLSFVNAAEGPFLNSSGSYASYFVMKKPGDSGFAYTDTFYVADTLLAAQLRTSATGSGVLATATFRVLTQGISKLDVHDTILLRYDPFTPRPIDHTSDDGYFALPLPKATVDPASIISSGLGREEVFNVTIKAVNLPNAYNWTLKLKWTPLLLNATDFTEGSFLKDAGATDFHTMVDQTGGFVYINNTFTGEPVSGVTGNGTLVTITFTVNRRGVTDLTLYDIKMFKKDGTFVPVAPENGYFSNVIRDVAITDISVSGTSVQAGQVVDITVVVVNHGFLNETFTVRVDYDSKSVGTQTVTNLAPNASQTLIFKWDTKDVSSGSYVIKATAATMPGEVNTGDNSRTASGNMTVTTGFDYSTILMIAGIAAIIVVVAVVGFFLYRRSRK